MIWFNSRAIQRNRVDVELVNQIEGLVEEEVIVHSHGKVGVGGEQLGEGRRRAEMMGTLLK